MNRLYLLILRVFCSVLFVLFLLPTTSSATVALGSGATQFIEEEIPISYWLADAEGLPLGDIIQNFNEGDFTQPAPHPIIGYFEGDVWFAIELQQTLPGELEWILEIRLATLDLIDFYILNLGNEEPSRHLRSGRLLPSTQRSMGMPWPVFDFSTDGAPAIIFLRVNSASLINITPAIYASSERGRIQNLTFAVLGAKYSAIAAIFLIGLVSAIILGSRNQIIVATYIFLNAFFWSSHDGVLTYFASDRFAPVLHFLHYTLLCISFAFSNIVFSIPLGVGRYSKGLEIVLSAISFISVAFLVLDLASGQITFMPAIINLMILSFTIFYPISIINLFLRQDRSIHIFSITYIFYGTLIVAGLLQQTGYGFSFLSFNVDPALSQFILSLGLIFSTLHKILRSKDLYFQQVLKVRDMSEVINDLEVRLKGRDYILDVVDHEVRTPVNNILASVQSLRMIDELQAPHLERNLRYEKIQRNARTLKRLIEFIGLSHLRGTIGVSDAKCDAMFEVFKILEGSAVENRVKINSRTSAGPQFIAIDKAMFQFVFSNLLDNAFKYSLPDTRIEVFVEERISEGGKYLLLTLQNISRYPLERNLTWVFEKRRRSEGAKSHAGLGMGLFLVKWIVEAYNGAISASAEECNVFAISVKLPFSDQLRKV